MVHRIRKETYWPALLAIADQDIEIKSFEQTGKKLVDNRLLRMTDVANALEQAYSDGGRDGLQR
ncbi:hypothetical protein J8I87_13300 [Paraburkholderia sp. LEh10]|uniref:hypothetical protein n=1 Tax=Paraburkholderia sp. LEh10 TaxID=2821353 RepID=UPI001AEB9C16|nr:hypothetical protein [Paraburkholderia sp. LEh10]MBP0590676.1 hypothetical protein [Paraburkholderia sp. LEh10]